MSITFEILGAPGKDNALLVTIDAGQSQSKLLFDCGENCLANTGVSEIKSIQHLFFSHLHMDHISGFDSFFRINYSRNYSDNHIWGPPQTSRILHNRLRGFMWNLHENMSSRWYISNIIDDKQIETFRYELQDAFETEHRVSSVNTNGPLCRGDGYSVYAITLNHNTPSIGYLVKEDTHINIDSSRLEELGLRPGPWLRELKSGNKQHETIYIEGKVFPLDELSEQLIVKKEGESIAYLTDFLLDEQTHSQLTRFLYKCNTVVCESQYRHCDYDLARRNFHTTATQCASLAKQADVSNLVLFHISERYLRYERIGMLQEARDIFAESSFPPHWNLY